MCRLRMALSLGMCFFLICSIPAFAVGMQDDDTAIDAVKAMITSHEDFTRDGDLEGVLSNSTDDVVIIAPGAPPIIGIDAYRDFEEAYLAAWHTDFVHDYAGISVEGETVVAYGIANGTMTPTNGGETIRFSNNFMLVARRQKGGGYKFAYVAFAPGG